MGKRRVVITGVGVVSPLGLTAEASWLHAKSGVSGIALSTHPKIREMPFGIAGEVKHFTATVPVGPFEPEEGYILKESFHPKDVKRYGRFVHLGVVAGLEAYGQSGLDPFRPSFSQERIGVNIGVGIGGFPEIEQVHNDLLQKGYRKVTPFFITQVIANMPSGLLSILLRTQGTNVCNVTACASSAHAIGESMRVIQRDEADVMITGGAEAALCELSFSGFGSMKALSTQVARASEASRPFDQERDGFVMGEGAAVFVLEELEFAKKRGARILGEILGYGANADAYHITAPSPAHKQGLKCMEMALRDAGLKPMDVDYVNAHGTSTPLGDKEELAALHQLFRECPVSISSTKSMTGHLLGAAGALEAFFCLGAIRDQFVPPTLHLSKVEAGFEGLDLVPQQGKARKVRVALSNSFGFGGTNASLILGQYET